MAIPNYKESVIAGTKHTRCYHISVYNPYGGEPHVSFHEEVVHILGENDVLQRNAGQLSTGIDLTEALVDPETGKSTTYGELFRWMALAYLQEAAARDQRDAERELERKAQELLDEYEGDKEYTLEDVIGLLQEDPSTVL